MNHQLNTGVSNIIAIDLPKKESFYQKREEALKTRRAQLSQESVSNQQSMPVQQPVIQNAPSNENIFQAPSSQQAINPNIGQETIENIAGSLPTNADLISQSFNAPVAPEIAVAQPAPTPIFSGIQEQAPMENIIQQPVAPVIQNQVVQSADINSEEIALEIFHDLVRLQDEYDKIMGKLIKLLPNKEVIQANTNQNVSQELVSPTINENFIHTPPQDNQMVMNPQMNNNTTLPTQSGTDLINEFNQAPVQNPVQEISPFIPSTDNIFDMQKAI